ncbi:hypothetical protein [Metasolibacillus sp.]|uniref:hypothetical protein n=1 Tax=Metasolibacillus sp. TaxID=2703680 RepID=UPI0025CBD084|nr:hypothetical protein [Metasolibacillus sp.]MCT6926290.1 hypothetical protein [Metasolibacillus sp.]MCT6942528.1 hypothetical protein [Metasolibacillus sp.]
MSIVQIKIDNDANILKYITLIRKFNSALPIQTIKSNIKNGHYVVSHDLYAYNVVDELLEIDHTARFRQLLVNLITAGATVHIYCDDELITLQYLDNLIAAMHETERALQQEMDRFLGEG